MTCFEFPLGAVRSCVQNPQKNLQIYFYSVLLNAAIKRSTVCPGLYSSQWEG